MKMYRPPSALHFRIQLGDQEENGVAVATAILAPVKKEGPVSQRFTEQEGRVPSSAGLSELGEDVAPKR